MTTEIARAIYISYTVISGSMYRRYPDGGMVVGVHGPGGELLTDPYVVNDRLMCVGSKCWDIARPRIISPDNAVAYLDGCRSVVRNVAQKWGIKNWHPNVRLEDAATSSLVSHIDLAPNPREQEADTAERWGRRMLGAAIHARR